MENVLLITPKPVYLNILFNFFRCSNLYSASCMHTQIVLYTFLKSHDCERKYTLIETLVLVA